MRLHTATHVVTTSAATSVTDTSVALNGSVNAMSVGGGITAVGFHLASNATALRVTPAAALVAGSYAMDGSAEGTGAAARFQNLWVGDICK